jgi:hypothetical protein
LNFRRISAAVDKSIDMSGTTFLALFVLGIGMKFNRTEEFSVPMPIKGVITDVELNE